MQSNVKNVEMDIMRIVLVARVSSPVITILILLESFVSASVQRDSKESVVNATPAPRTLISRAASPRVRIALLAW